MSEVQPVKYKLLRDSRVLEILNVSTRQIQVLFRGRISCIRYIRPGRNVICLCSQFANNLINISDEVTLSINSFQGVENVMIRLESIVSNVDFFLIEPRFCNGRKTVSDIFVRIHNRTLSLTRLYVNDIFVFEDNDVTKKPFSMCSKNCVIPQLGSL